MTALPSGERDLGEWRVEIDRLNLELLTALNNRARCALAIAALKKRMNLPIYDPNRESQLFNHVLAHNKGPLSDDSVRRMFECIVSEHRLLQEEGPKDGWEPEPPPRK